MSVESTKPDYEGNAEFKTIGGKLYARVCGGRLTDDVACISKYQFNTSTPWVRVDRLKSFHHSRYDTGEADDIDIKGMICPNCNSEDFGFSDGIDWSTTRCRDCEAEFSAIGYSWFHELEDKAKEYQKNQAKQQCCDPEGEMDESYYK